jgi:hypothetical protein
MNFRALVPAEDDSTHPSLTPGAQYLVLEVEDDSYRLIDDAGDPVLFPRALFDVIGDSPKIEAGFAARPGYYEELFNSTGDYLAQRRARVALREAISRALATVTDTDVHALVRETLDRFVARHFRWDCTLANVAVRGTGQDRVRVFERDRELMICVADGAGGTANGALAAETIVDARFRVPSSVNARDLLCELDGVLVRFGGQSTGILLSIRDGEITGASVGDSEAWLVRDADVIVLTAQQQRKPLVGDGCEAVAISPTQLATGTLVVATDGLFRYVKRGDIARIARQRDLDAAIRDLLDAARVASRDLQDDVAIVLCRAGD